MFLDVVIPQHQFGKSHLWMFGFPTTSNNYKETIFASAACQDPNGSFFTREAPGHDQQLLEKQTGGEGGEGTEGSGSSFRNLALHRLGHAVLLYMLTWNRGYAFNLPLRMVFPTVQQNQSPLSVVPAFLDCLAKKMEHATKEQDSH